MWVAVCGHLLAGLSCMWILEAQLSAKQVKMGKDIQRERWGEVGKGWRERCWRRVEKTGGRSANLICRQSAALKMTASQEIYNHLIEGMKVIIQESWHVSLRLNRAKEGVFMIKTSTQVLPKFEEDAQEEKCFKWLLWIISNIPPGNFCTVQSSESFTCFSIQSFPFHLLAIFGLIVQVLFK